MIRRGHKMPVKKGDKVKVDYTGTLQSGAIFDSSKGREPITFEAGSGQVIKGFDQAVIGMEKGQEKTITIKPEEAYGMPDQELIRKIPRSQLPPGPQPKPGMMLLMGTTDGQRMPAKITKVDETEVTIDLNHPLSGKTLIFQIKIVEINP